MICCRCHFAMAYSSFSIVFLFFLFLLHGLPSAAANLQKTTSIFRSHPVSEPTLSLAADTPPTTYFEVTKPIAIPPTKSCSYTVLRHDFASTYGKPPVLANYTPPADCPSQNFEKIVLELTSTCKGRQFDRIFGIWLGGVEILRSCSAEPRATGIVWTVKKDITRYHSLLTNNQTLAFYMGNIVDNTYTGVYHVILTFHFYAIEENPDLDSAEINGSLSSPADLILPVSRNLPLNDGLWFEIQNSSHQVSKELKIPQNSYKALLEVYVSFHENDEFWYGNYPNEYISANNLTGSTGNGPFREILVSLDELLVGAVYPFTVIYTGGVNPLLWRPITGIGSFDLPSYDIEITPLLERLLDGKAHKFAFRVTNALNVWFVDANLHIWLDHKSEKTQGKLLKHIASPLSLSIASDFTGLDGKFITNVERSIFSHGSVRSSSGLIVYESRQEFRFSNTMILQNNGSLQIVNQEIHFNDSFDSKMPSSSSSVESRKSLNRFDLYLYTSIIDGENGSYVSLSNVSLGIEEKKTERSGSKIYSSSRLKNKQNGEGNIVVKGNLVVSGVGRTHQEYHYTSDDSCYSRSVSSSNYTIFRDEESDTCTNGRPSSSPFHVYADNITDFII